MSTQGSLVFQKLHHFWLLLMLSLASIYITSSVQAQPAVVSTTLSDRAAEDLGGIDTTVSHHDLWDLSQEEWERVELLQNGLRRYVSDVQISPLEVLGIHARSIEERERYARRWAQLMLTDAERILKFQRAYDEAMQSLINNQPVIDISQLPARQSVLPVLMKSDRIALFIDLECVACLSLLHDSIEALPRVAGLDVYFLGLEVADNELLRRWATHHQVSRHLVESKRVTLNHDAGLLSRVNPRAMDVPVLMKRRGHRFLVLDPSALQ